MTNDKQLHAGSAKDAPLTTGFQSTLNIAGMGSHFVS
jgi:hypothetical protein